MGILSAHAGKGSWAGKPPMARLPDEVRNGGWGKGSPGAGEREGILVPAWGPAWVCQSSPFCTPLDPMERVPPGFSVAMSLSDPYAFASRRDHHILRKILHVFGQNLPHQGHQYFAMSAGQSDESCMRLMK